MFRRWTIHTFKFSGHCVLSRSQPLLQGIILCITQTLSASAIPALEYYFVYQHDNYSIGPHAWAAWSLAVLLGLIVSIPHTIGTSAAFVSCVANTQNTQYWCRESWHMDQKAKILSSCIWLAEWCLWLHIRDTELHGGSSSNFSAAFLRLVFLDVRILRRARVWWQEAVVLGI